MNELSSDISLLRDWREFKTANKQMTYPFGAHLVISDHFSLEGVTYTKARVPDPTVSVKKTMRNITALPVSIDPWAEGGRTG